MIKVTPPVLSWLWFVCVQCIRECQAVISQARALQGSRAGRRGGGPAVMEAAAAATDPSASPRPASADGSSAEPSLTDGKPVDVVVAKAYARMGSAYRKLGKHTRAVNAFLLSLKERADPQVRSPPACSTDKSQRPRPHPPPPPLRAVVWLGRCA